MGLDAHGNSRGGNVTPRNGGHSSRLFARQHFKKRVGSNVVLGAAGALFLATFLCFLGYVNFGEHLQLKQGTALSGDSGKQGAIHQSEVSRVLEGRGGVALEAGQGATPGQKGEGEPIEFDVTDLAESGLRGLVTEPHAQGLEMPSGDPGKAGAMGEQGLLPGGTSGGGGGYEAASAVPPARSPIAAPGNRDQGKEWGTFDGADIRLGSSRSETSSSGSGGGANDYGGAKDDAGPGGTAEVGGADAIGEEGRANVGVDGAAGGGDVGGAEDGDGKSSSNGSSSSASEDSFRAQGIRGLSADEEDSLAGTFSRRSRGEEDREEGEGARGVDSREHRVEGGLALASGAGGGADGEVPRRRHEGTDGQDKESQLESNSSREDESTGREEGLSPAAAAAAAAAGETETALPGATGTGVEEGGVQGGASETAEGDTSPHQLGGGANAVESRQVAGDEKEDKSGTAEGEGAGEGTVADSPSGTGEGLVVKDSIQVAGDENEDGSGKAGEEGGEEGPGDEVGDGSSSGIGRGEVEEAAGSAAEQGVLAAEPKVEEQEEQAGSLRGQVEAETGGGGSRERLPPGSDAWELDPDEKFVWYAAHGGFGNQVHGPSLPRALSRDWPRCSLWPPSARRAVVGPVLCPGIPGPCCPLCVFPPSVARAPTKLTSAPYVPQTIWRQSSGSCMKALRTGWGGGAIIKRVEGGGEQQSSEVWRNRSLAQVSESLEGPGGGKALSLSYGL
eukprot:jgi/Mesen1/4244/ME000022S03541